MAYIHLPRGPERAQSVSGTVSLRTWDSASGDPAELELDDGLRVAINVSRESLSDCSRNRILRFTANWLASPGPSA
jgi:hypothetical protein